MTDIKFRHQQDIDRLAAFGLEPTEEHDHRGILLDGIEAQDRKINDLQFRVDTLMLEHCPDNITEEQWKGWEENQVEACEARDYD